MNQLEVIVLDEPHTVSTSEELGEVLGRRVGGGNHFMIASATAEYPMLDLMVRDDFAMLHYFAQEGVGSQAVGSLADPPEEVEFPDSSMGDMLSMPGSVLIDAPTALRCVHQFAETLDRPDLVDWIEL